MQFKIYDEDEDILVCLKPVGLAVQTARMAEQDMVSLIKNYLVQQGAGRDPYLGLIHRLDQPVGGLLVFAKGKKAAASLSRQMGKEGVHKEYLALCLGHLPSPEGTLVHYLKKDKASGKALITNEQDKEGKRAELSYCTKAVWENCSLLRIRLKTGRFHQIRAQLSAAGHPLLGEKKYGNQESQQKSAARGITSVALFACRLGFCHPSTKKRMEFIVDREDLPQWCQRDNQKPEK